MMMCTAETDYSHSSYMCTAEHSRNLTVYLIRTNSPAATDQETSDIMILLQKLDELETSAEKEQIFKLTILLLPLNTEQETSDIMIFLHELDE